MIRTVLVGAGGRMGRTLLRLLPEFPELALHGAVNSAGSTSLGCDTGELIAAAPSGVRVVSTVAPLLADADLVIDFSRADAVGTTLAACVAARTPLLIGTTGLAPSLQQPLADAAGQIALLVAANTSIGVTLLLQLVRTAAQALDSSYDIEIVETHHRNKLDAPSGTALALGAAAAAGRGVELASVLAPPTRAGARERGRIGMSVSRGGDVVGDHEVRFLGTGERLTLGHFASDRSIFARGALTAGRWLAGQAPGRYEMSNVFL